jgi:hypothetical protein
VFPPLDQQKVAAGERLYERHCQKCHLPPHDVLADLERSDHDQTYRPKYWWQSRSGNWYIKVTDVKVDYVGTDPHEAADFKSRTADTGDLRKGIVIWGVANAFFKKENIQPEAQTAWSGGRDPEELRVRAELVYKARPLNGVWAVGHYLHNGSVPTLDALLSPDDADRPRTFWVGNRQFDPVKVGYQYSQVEGATLFDTTKPGNANTGHRFKDGPRGKGIIGPSLSVVERAQLIEYLKSLKPLRPWS